MYNLYFDFASCFGFAGMIFAVIYRKTSSTSSGKFFLMILCVGLLSSIFDVLSVTSQVGEVIMYLANLGYLACRAWSAMSFCFYIIGITDNWHKLRSHPFLMLLLFIPLLVVIAALATNYWTKWMFMVKGGVYQRGMLINYGIMYWVTLLYFVVALVYLIKYRSFFTKAKMLAIVAIYPLGVVALTLQSLLTNVLIEIFFTCIACYLIMVMVERPEEFFEPEIELKKYTAFSMDSNKAVVTKKRVTIIFSKIVNEQTVNAKLDYDQQVDLRRTIGNIIKESAKDFSMKGEYYWLGQGKYAAVLEETLEKSSDSFAMTLRRRLNVPIKCNFGIVDIYANVALIRCPEDIDSVDMCIAFFESFYHITGVLENVMVLADLPNKREFEIKMHMDSIIKNALLHNNFEVYYQPIYSVKEKAFTRAEALVRLKDEHYGFVSPDLFLPEAERNGSIHKIGDIVMDNVCKFIASSEFERLGLEFIEVNLSVVQCMHEDLPIHIMDALKRYNVSPSKINFDITETVDAYSHKMMEDNIRILKEYGISISLDDFGSGYSSADNVTSMPIDVVKLDRTVVKSIDNPQLKLFFEHTISMIRDMKRNIVVEGVETEEKVTEFENYLCDYIQGYYFSKPLPKNDFISFIQNKDNIPLAAKGIFGSSMERKDEAVEPSAKDADDSIKESIEAIKEEEKLQNDAVASGSLEDTDADLKEPEETLDLAESDIKTIAEEDAVLEEETQKEDENEE